MNIHPLKEIVSIKEEHCSNPYPYSCAACKSCTCTYGFYHFTGKHEKFRNNNCPLHSLNDKTHST
jgi:hypothetical protein